MESTIVIHFLKKFSKREMIGLGLFIQNPCFNSNKDVIKLFEYLKGFASDFDDVNMTAENAFKEIYPSKTFKASTINVLMTRLLSVIKKFISALQSTKNQVEIEINTLMFCKEDMPKKFEQQLKKTRKLINKKEKGNRIYHYMILTEYELSRYLAVHNKPINYNALLEVIDKFYWLTKLPLFAEVLNYKLITADNEYDFSELDVYLKFVEEVEYTKVPLIKLWHYLVKIFKNIINKVPVTLQDYQIFKTLFFQNIEDLNTHEKRNLYIYLRNIIRLSSFEDADYSKEEFEIDQLGLDEGLIFLNGYLRELSVKNIINSAIRVGEIQWAKDFLHQYKDIFWRRYADDILAYCTAVINFYERKYDEALALFTTIEYNNLFFEIEKRIKLIQIYYEREELDLFENTINSLRAYISRNQDSIGDIYMQAYRNFVNFTKRMSGIIKRDLVKITKLEAEISNIPVRLLFEKKWLLEKLNELK